MRPRLAPFAPLLAAVACGGVQPPGAKPGTDSAPLDDSGPSLDTAAPPAACALADVHPRTLPAHAGGEVTWTWACDGPVDAAGAWTLPLPTGELSATATAGGATLRLQATVPAGAVGPGAHDLGGPSQDGEPRPDLALPLRAHADPAAVAAALRGGGWNTWGGAAAESASFFLGDPDGNGRLDLLGTLLEPGGEVIQTSQRADGAGPLQVRRGLAHTSESGVFTSGGMAWVDAGHGAVMALVGGTEPGHVMHVRQSTWAEHDWTITVLRLNHGFMRERVPDLLLGMETVWRGGDAPEVDLLGVVDRGAGPLGLACQDTECWEWGTLGSVSPAAVQDGQGFAGTLTGGELTGLQTQDREPLFWAISQPKPDGAVRVEVLAGEPRDGAFSLQRAVALPAPGFPLQAVGTAAEDLDGDGTLELVVELWGDGGWAAWLVPDAHDPESRRAPVGLGRVVHGAVWTAPGPTATGASAMLPSSFARNDRALRATLLRADGAVDRAGTALVQVLEWDPADLLAEGTTRARPVRAGIAGRVDLPAAPCTAPSGAPLAACRGTWVARGVAAAGEVGSAHPDDAFTAGDHLLVVPAAGQDRVLVGRGLHPAAEAAPAPVAAVGAQGDAWLDGRDGLRLRDGAGDLGAACHGAVQAAETPDGPRFLGQAPQDCRGAGTGHTVWGGDAATGLTLVGGDAGTPLTLLHESAAGGGWPVLWRRGDGQAWSGALDLTADPPVFRDTPVAVGSPVNPEALALGPLRRGVAQLSAPPPAPLPWGAGWTDGAALPGAPEGPATALVVGAVGACGHATAVLRGGVLAPLFESADPSCADLPIPQAAARLGDLEVLVSLTPAGALSLTRLDGDVAQHRSLDTGMPEDAAPGPHARVETGDLNGDGLDDLLLLGWVGAAPRVLLLDGLGGTLPAAALDEPDTLLDLAGIARPAPGRPAPVREWDPALPLVQRRITPLVVP